jgi:hypothetical protein
MLNEDLLHDLADGSPLYEVGAKRLQFGRVKDADRVSCQLAHRRMTPASYFAAVATSAARCVGRVDIHPSLSMTISSNTGISSSRLARIAEGKFSILWL